MSYQVQTLRWHGWCSRVDCSLREIDKPVCVISCVLSFAKSRTSQFSYYTETSHNKDYVKCFAFIYIYQMLMLILVVPLLLQSLLWLFENNIRFWLCAALKPCDCWDWTRYIAPQTSCDFPMIDTTVGEIPDIDEKSPWGKLSMQTMDCYLI